MEKQTVYQRVTKAVSKTSFIVTQQTGHVLLVHPYNHDFQIQVTEGLEGKLHMEFIGTSEVAAIIKPLLDKMALLLN